MLSIARPAESGAAPVVDLSVEAPGGAYLVVLNLEAATRFVRPRHPREARAGAPERADGRGRGRPLDRRPQIFPSGDREGTATLERFLAIVSDRPIDLSRCLFEGERSRGRAAWEGLDGRTWGVSAFDIEIR